MKNLEKMSQEMGIELTEPNLEPLSSIEVKYKIGRSRLEKYQKILIVSFSGEYASGCQGNDAAGFMHAKEIYARKLLNPAGVIIDFSDLHYEWGDMIEIVYEGIVSKMPYQYPMSMALIVGEHCAEAIGTLICDSYGLDPATNADATKSMEWIFDNFEDAWNYVEKQLQEKRCKF